MFQSWPGVCSLQSAVWNLESGVWSLESGLCTVQTRLGSTARLASHSQGAPRFCRAANNCQQLPAPIGSASCLPAATLSPSQFCSTRRNNGTRAPVDSIIVCRIGSPETSVATLNTGIKPSTCSLGLFFSFFFLSLPPPLADDSRLRAFFFFFFGTPCDETHHGSGRQPQRHSRTRCDDATTLRTRRKSPYQIRA